MDYKTFIFKYFPSIVHYRFQVIRALKWIFQFLKHLPGDSTYFGPPRGIYCDFEDYSRRVSHPSVSTIIFKEQEKHLRFLPKTNSILVKKKFQELLHPISIERRAFIFQNARYLYGNGGTIITSDDKIFLPTSPLKNEFNPQRHQSFYKLKLPKLKMLEKVVLIDTWASVDNYFHWVKDCLPRFYWLEKSQLNLAQYILVISSKNLLYQTETLKILEAHGFIFKSVLLTADLKYFKADEIVVPPYITNAFNSDKTTALKEELEFLKLNLMSPSEVKNNDKIFVSRRRSIRSSSSEDRLLDELTKVGFKEIFLEDYPVNEQFQIFNQAKVIVGLHGAGFTNLCFCEKGTKVIEIFGADFIVTDYWNIANVKELNYYAYCEDSLLKDLSTYRLCREEPIEFNVEKLMKFIENAMTPEKLS